MRLTEISYDSARPVDGYGPGFFRIDGQVIEGAVLVTQRSAVAWDGFGDSAALCALAGEVDLIFIGTGAEMRALPAALRESLEQAGIGVEPMASPTACRTYNVLLSEGRRIALAALPV